jgi:hypothetical protein
MSKVGRPKKEIDRKDFESLCAIQCTLEEIVAFFDNKLGGCSKDTIERWCLREYKDSFANVSRLKRQLGKISLRRHQMRLAEKSSAMAIFLGKNMLGQKENFEEKTDNSALDKLVEAINKVADYTAENEK